jgi:hypothetical protein
MHPTPLKKTDPSSHQRERPTKQDRNCQTVINIWSRAPDGARHQDLLADVSRNVTFTLREQVRTEENRTESRTEGTSRAKTRQQEQQLKTEYRSEDETRDTTD